MEASIRSPALHLRLSTKNYWPEVPRTSIFLTLMKILALRPSIRLVPLATRKGSTLAIGNSCCTPWPLLDRWPAPAEHQRFHRGDVYMPITPMFHVHAWGMPYVATSMGVKQVYPGRYLPDTLLNLIKQEHVTFSHCVPTILHMMLSSPASSDVDLSGWKVVIGGSALPKGLARWPWIGASRCSAAMVCQRPVRSCRLPN